MRGKSRQSRTSVKGEDTAVGGGEGSLSPQSAWPLLQSKRACNSLQANSLAFYEEPLLQQRSDAMAGSQPSLGPPHTSSSQAAPLLPGEGEPPAERGKELCMEAGIFQSKQVSSSLFLRTVSFKVASLTSCFPFTDKKRRERGEREAQMWITGYGWVAPLLSLLLWQHPLVVDHFGEGWVQRIAEKHRGNSSVSLGLGFLYFWNHS